MGSGPARGAASAPLLILLLLGCPTGRVDDWH